MPDVGATSSKKPSLADALGLGANAPADLTPPAKPAKPAAPGQTADPAAKILPELGLSESDVSPGSGGSKLETTPMPNTNPAGVALGLAETDVSPGVSPPSAVPVPQTPAKPVGGGPSAAPPVVGQQAKNAGPAQPYDSGTAPVAPGPAPGGPSQADMQAVAQEIKKDPGIGQQLLDLAKNTGRGIGELVQGFAAGYSRSDIPLASQVRQAEKMQKLTIDAQKERQIADQQFQENLAKIQNKYVNDRFQASSAQEVAEAQKNRDAQAKQAGLDRQAAMDRLNAELEKQAQIWGYGRAGQLQSLLSQALGQGRVE